MFFQLKLGYTGLINNSCQTVYLAEVATECSINSSFIHTEFALMNKPKPHRYFFFYKDGTVSRVVSTNWSMEQLTTTKEWPERQTYNPAEFTGSSPARTILAQLLGRACK